MNEEDLHDVVSDVVDGMIAEMTFEDMRRYVWDSLYDDLIHQHWGHILAYADKYSPESIEKFG